MRLALAALLLIGCKEPKDFPPTGPGGPGGSGGVNDGGTDAVRDTGDAMVSSGRVCVVQDLRKLTTCDATGAGDIVVTIGNAMATTEDDGTFTIDIPSGTGLQWQLEHPDFITSIAQLSSSLLIPMIRADDYADLLGDNGIILDPTQGSVVMQILDGNDLPFPNSTAVGNPAAQFPTRYDGNSAIIWDQDATSTLGVAWLPGIASATTTITVTPAGNTPRTTTVPVQAGALTFGAISF
jgi:hypothetical protein